ncbi:GFA family protein [Dongia sp.]|uniref:GFA family protein n=1 Tax=Dongia sp. TaxID=1977262 RepID=UPI0037507A89
MEGTRSGGCVCGAVRFTATGEPLRVTLCHCTWCQRRTGSAFGTEVVFESGQVAFTGAPAKYRHHSDESGRWLDVEFCRNCGTNLGFTLELAPGLRTLPAGAFDDPRWIRPEAVAFKHIYLRSRRPWSDLTPLVEQYERHFRAS